MRKFWVSSALLATALGCSQSNPPPAASTPLSTAPTEEPLPEGATLVTLKLPEMT